MLMKNKTLEFFSAKINIANINHYMKNFYIFVGLKIVSFCYKTHAVQT